MSFHRYIGSMDIGVINLELQDLRGAYHDSDDKEFKEKLKRYIHMRRVYHQVHLFVPLSVTNMLEFFIEHKKVTFDQINRACSYLERTI